MILWWEIPHRRHAEAAETAVLFPAVFPPRRASGVGDGRAARVQEALEIYTGRTLTTSGWRRGLLGRTGFARASRVAAEVFTAKICPLPALEMLIAEMLAIHFCSDQQETLLVLEELGAEVDRRVAAGVGVLPADAVRVFWVNPVADLRVMNLLEDAGGRVCGTDYLFCHALDLDSHGYTPLGGAGANGPGRPDGRFAGGSCPADLQRYPPFWGRGGGDLPHSRRQPLCLGGDDIAEMIRSGLGIPLVEIEVPPISDALEPTLRTRLEALLETVRNQSCGEEDRYRP